MRTPINPNAPVISKSQIEIAAPVHSVWNVLTGISNWPSWQKAVTKTTVHGEIKEGTAFDWKAGGLSFKSKIHTCVPESMFGWTGKTIGTDAVHNWFFEARGTSTLVKVEESLEGILPKLFKGFFQKNLDDGLKRSLVELKMAAEKLM